ncbi:MAG: crossover junction endodeoxyribonuclease RuvC [Clostridia bacterium]
MLILGIDPGYAIVGYGLVSYDNYKFKPKGHGAITTKAKVPMHLRLLEIQQDMITLLETFKPDMVAVEKLFFNTNTKTAIDVAQARGVIIVVCASKNIPIYEYTPLQVKQSVTGYGRAEKNQVMEMTKSILGLSAVAKPDDASDALAVAICHGNTYNSNLMR